MKLVRSQQTSLRASNYREVPSSNPTQLSTTLQRFLITDQKPQKSEILDVGVIAEHPSQQNDSATNAFQRRPAQPVQSQTSEQRSTDSASRRYTQACVPSQYMISAEYNNEKKGVPSPLEDANIPTLRSSTQHQATAADSSNMKSSRLMESFASEVTLSSVASQSTKQSIVELAGQSIAESAVEPVARDSNVRPSKTHPSTVKDDVSQTRSSGIALQRDSKQQKSERVLPIKKSEPVEDSSSSDDQLSAKELSGLAKAKKIQKKTKEYTIADVRMGWLRKNADEQPLSVGSTRTKDETEVVEIPSAKNQLTRAERQRLQQQQPTIEVKQLHEEARATKQPPAPRKAPRIVENQIVIQDSFESLESSTSEHVQVRNFRSPLSSFDDEPQSDTEVKNIMFPEHSSEMVSAAELRAEDVESSINRSIQEQKRRKLAQIFQ